MKTGKKNTQEQNCSKMLLEYKYHNKGLISQLLSSKYLEAQFSLFLIKLHSKYLYKSSHQNPNLSQQWMF